METENYFVNYVCYLEPSGYPSPIRANGPLMVVAYRYRRNALAEVERLRADPLLAWADCIRRRDGLRIARVNNNR